MKQVMMIKFDSLKWRMIDEYKVANPFIESAFGRSRMSLICVCLIC